MIKYPLRWKLVGNKPSNKLLIDILLNTVETLGCINLSLSGGVDSSLMLSLMYEVFGDKVSCFNLACSTKHPDYIFSEMISRHYGVVCYHFIPDAIDNNDGDAIVSAFYSNLSIFHHIASIIACDGIDELMGGYYDHASLADNEVFFDYLSRLQNEQLIPLDINSKSIQVFLPYLSTDFIALTSFIPLSDRYRLGYRKQIIYDMAKDRGIPNKILERRKYGFVDAMNIKGVIK